MERRPGSSSDTPARAAFRVCEKLREPLSTLVGTHGFRTFLARALSLAKADAAWLERMTLGSDGRLTFPAELERGLDPADAASGAIALVGRVLDLLATFIGDALTRGLVEQIWPNAVLDEPPSGGKT